MNEIGDINSPNKIIDIIISDFSVAVVGLGEEEEEEDDASSLFITLNQRSEPTLPAKQRMTKALCDRKRSKRSMIRPKRAVPRRPLIINAEPI